MTLVDSIFSISIRSRNRALGPALQSELCFRLSSSIVNLISFSVTLICLSKIAHNRGKLVQHIDKLFFISLKRSSDSYFVFLSAECTALIVYLHLHMLVYLHFAIFVLVFNCRYPLTPIQPRRVWHYCGLVWCHITWRSNSRWLLLGSSGRYRVACGVRLFFPRCLWQESKMPDVVKCPLFDGLTTVRLFSYVCHVSSSSLDFFQNLSPSRLFSVRPVLLLLLCLGGCSFYIRYCLAGIPIECLRFFLEGCGWYNWSWRRVQGHYFPS